jgi:NDP-sugar pyrophosphorylase family protein
MLLAMKAMILAAGLGSRLGVLGRNTPKCLLPLLDRETILDHVIHKLIRFGVSEIIINTHHLAEQVEEHLKQKRYYDIAIHISHEDELLDTGGGLKNVRRYFQEEPAFIVHNADIFCTANLSEAYQNHIEHGLTASLICMTRDSQRGLFVDESKKITGWTGEQPPYTPHTSERLVAFSGISICSPSIFHYMPDTDRFSIIEAFLAASRDTHKVSAYHIDASTWADIGTPEKLATLQKQLRNKDRAYLCDI